MHIIWKTPIAIIPTQQVTVPKGAVFRCVQMQGSTPTIWFTCDPREDKVKRAIRIIPTGAEFEETSVSQYIGTFQHLQSGTVWHVFEEA